ncbi:MAG: hypothetical protein ACOX3S_05675 [Anaerolineae bacterium]|jgi:hypothetical protein
MWGTVWNRVALLAAGMLLGWNLPHYWAAPRDRRRDLAVRLALGALLGAMLIVPLALTNRAAALLGLAVIAFCALVAYAANARQLLRASWEPPYMAPDAPSTWSDVIGVYLVGAWESRTYDGPAPWATYIRQRAARGLATTHWMAFPRACGRVRRAYARMGRVSPAVEALETLGSDLGALLDGRADVQLHSSMAGTPFAGRLRQALVKGTRELVVVPLGLDAAGIEQLREAITASRVREAGAVVRLASAIDVSAWIGKDQQRLDRLWQGETIAAPTAAPPDLVAALLAAVSQATAPTA